MLFRDFMFKITFYVIELINKQYVCIQQKNYLINCIHTWKKISKFLCSHTIHKKMKSSNDMLLLKNVHSQWHFVKFISSISIVIDFVLLMKTSAVVKIRKQSMNSIIELFNQTNMKNATIVEKKINLIERRKNAFIQRDFFQYKITKNIVSKKHFAFIKGKIFDKNARTQN